MTNTLTGNTTPVRDPSVIRQNSTYYLFSTDPANSTPSKYLPIRCSADKLHWTSCGQVFTALPAWVKPLKAGINNLWAPDISYFNGLYHLYFSASTPGSQAPVIGLQTNTTLDQTHPQYRWLH